jgi:hypothetical protein
MTVLGSFSNGSVTVPNGSMELVAPLLFMVPGSLPPLGGEPGNRKGGGGAVAPLTQSSREPYPRGGG